jgi:hypothetical protein
MSAAPTHHRRLRSLRPRPPGSLRFEILETRRLLTPGIFLESFENDPTNPTGPVDAATAVGGLDAAGNFDHSFTGNYHLLPVTGHSTATAMPSLPFDLFLTGTDTITFPSVAAADEGVELASVLVLADGGFSVVKFVGTSDTLTLNFNYSLTWQEVTAGASDLGNGGHALGPIRSIFLETDEGEFDNVSIFVQGGVVDTQPVTASGASVTAPPGTPVSVSVFDLGEDPDGDSLTISGVTNGVTRNGAFVPSAGTAVIDGGRMTYTPPAQFRGTDFFGYTIEDGHGNSASAEVKVVVDTPPDAGAAVYELPHGSSGALSVPSPGFPSLLASAQDADHDALTVLPETKSTSLGGAVTIQADGSFSYTPPAGVILPPSGGDTFNYTVTDGLLDSQPGLVAVLVHDEAPFAGEFASSSPGVSYEFEHVPFGHPVVLQGSTTVGPLPASDAEGDHLTYLLVNLPAHGGLTLNSDGTFTYHANALEDSFDYKVFDGVLYSNVATAHLQVHDVAPTIDLRFEPFPTGNDSIEFGLVDFQAVTNPFEYDSRIDY